MTEGIKPRDRRFFKGEAFCVLVASPLRLNRFAGGWIAFLCLTLCGVLQWEAFEQRYGMDFKTFKQAWDEGRIADKHSYEVERDYWEWEATVTDEERLRQMLESLP